MHKPEEPPRKVFLFSGHMIDAPGRPEPRFPPNKEPVAAKAIADTLDELGAGPEDVALCGGACGGDLLFAEACLGRGLRLEILIPFDVQTFLAKSVTFAGESWRERFFQAAGHTRSRLLVLPEQSDISVEGATSYERNNLWLLNTAMAYGQEKVHLISLWDGKGGDGPGGTQHMVEVVRKHSGDVAIIDTNILFR